MAYTKRYGTEAVRTWQRYFESDKRQFERHFSKMCENKDAFRKREMMFSELDRTRERIAGQVSLAGRHSVYRQTSASDIWADLMMISDLAKYQVLERMLIFS